MSPSEPYQHGEPTEGMCCLCTLEDITVEDKNYVEYQCYPSLKWKPALYEESVMRQLLQEQFHSYIEKVKKSDCQAELKRLLEQGPPIYIHDKHALPLDQGDTHVVQLWFASTGREETAKLDGAVEGTEREELWESLKKFIIVEGKEEGDDADDEQQQVEES